MAEHGRIRLSSKQRLALELLRRSNLAGVITTGETAMIDGQPWINWRTAYSLHDKRLVWVTNYGEEDAEVLLEGSRPDA